MATPQLSPGILIREVDLTVGRADNVLDNIGAIAGPFTKGPINEVIDITTEQELLNVFGKPISTHSQYEYWMSASSFLSYGGILKVVRTSDDALNNANAGFNEAADADLQIDNFDDYEISHSSDSVTYAYAAKNPGSWANDLKVCVIDDKADQRVGISTTNPSAIGAVVGYGVTVALTNQVIATNSGTTETFSGYLKGIVTGVTTSATGQSFVDVKILSRVSSGATVTEITYSENDRASSFADNDTVQFINNTGISTGAQSISGITTIATGIASTNATIGSSTVYISAPAVGVTTGDYLLNGGINIIISGITTNTVSLASTISVGIATGATLTFKRNVYTTDSVSVGSVVDWYDQQTLGLTNSTVYWKSIAPKPVSNQFSLERNGKNDALHVVVIDDKGSVTGIQGNLLEKHTFLSKASDSVSAVNFSQKNFWKKYIGLYSQYVFAGANPSSAYDSQNNTSPAATGFTTPGGWTKIGTSDGIWNLDAQGVTFNAIGNVSYTLSAGKNYGGTDGAIATLGNLITSYSLFSNRDEVAVDYLIMGPGSADVSSSQAKANHLISIANQRKDCVAVISPHRTDVVGEPNNTTQTNNIIRFFSSLQSSSYAVFDSGYKYTYDRFNNTFRYIPCNPDIAGLMVRTSIVAYPWFSPAGQQRGILNNAIKLAYNPNKAQRDQLYSQRVNSITNQPGIGILLYGDKTALGYASAFDRINVRRLFLTVEQSLERAAQAQLFELNDEITRANFVNIVEPYLRDVQAKRGIYDFLVVCDESNNTPDIIDNNEFRANIFLKPAKSINYVTLTFVATRTGVSFEEVAGRV
jgi:hypothetical protein